MHQYTIYEYIYIYTLVLNSHSVVISGVPRITEIYTGYIIVTALCTASDKCIPRTSLVNCRATVIPGWNDYVKDKKAIAELWNFIWQQNGQPHHGTIAKILCALRNGTITMPYNIARKTKARSRQPKWPKHFYLGGIGISGMRLGNSQNRILNALLLLMASPEPRI